MGGIRKSERIGFVCCGRERFASLPTAPSALLRGHPALQRRGVGKPAVKLLLPVTSLPRHLISSAAFPAQNPLVRTLEVRIC